MSHTHCQAASVMRIFDHKNINFQILTLKIFLGNFWSADIQMLSSDSSWVILNRRECEWGYTRNLEILGIEQTCQSHISSSPVEDLSGEWNCSIMATLFGVFTQNRRMGLIICIGGKTVFSWLLIGSDCFLLEKPCIQRLWSVNQSDVSVQSRGGVQGHLRGGRDWPLPWFTRTAICRCSVTTKAAALKEQGHLWGVVAHRHSKNVLAHWKFSLTCGNFECWCEYLYHGLDRISVPLFKASQRQQWFSGITVAWQGGFPGSFVHGSSIVSNMESWSLCSLRIWST